MARVSAMCAAYVRELTAPDTVGLVSEKVAAGKPWHSCRQEVSLLSF